MSQAAMEQPVAAEAVWGVAAEFAGPDALRKAARKVRKAGYGKFDVHSPYPIHGMDMAMGLGRSKLGWLVLACGIAGVVVAMGLQWYTNTYDYPLITQGKPYFSWQAFIVVAFELMVLFAAFGAVFGMIAFNGLPAWYHPALKWERFLRFSDNKFFLVIEAADPRFDVAGTAAMLRAMGASRVEMLEQ